MALKVTADFSGVSEGGATRIPAGEYVFKIVKVEKRKSQKEGGGEYLNWRLTGVTGEAKNSTIFYVTSLKPQALWNLYNFLVAVGIDVPKKKVSVDVEKCIGKYVGATVEDEEYNGKKRSSIVSVYGVKKNSKGQWERVGAVDEDDVPNDLDEDNVPDDLDEDTAAELEEELAEEIEEAAPEKPKKKQEKKAKPAKKAKEEEEEPEDGDDDSTESDEDLDLNELEEDLDALEEEIQ